MRSGRTAALLALALAAPLGGCIVPYSRVGGTSHRKLYRGDLETVAGAAERALSSTGASGLERESREAGVALRGASGPRAEVRTREHGLVEVAVDDSLDWREAVAFHRRVAEELGLLKRRNP